eukprot:TRINITY_DN8326_c0_g1_i7.p1 TRINITY_DN8326_c0_g1~~TRINITY_DN8326_c0_g1_i7.p1  ORF type:complete len:725 (-),score=162.17 TRINITY_DN8326_c0_g1_i7:105-2279(-)
MLRSLLFSPLSLGNSFLPTMPTDERLQLMNVLGGGWYECPKGHTYYVSECGRPTQEYECPSCGSKIGGLNHQLEPSNLVSQKVDKTLPGYLLTEAEVSEDIFNSERNLPSISFRLLRFIVHVLLTTSSQISTELSNEVQILTGSQKTNVTEFLVQHLRRDWSILNKLLGKNLEEVAYFLHLTCVSIKNSNSGLLVCANLESRMALENTFHTTHVQPVLENFDSLVKKDFVKVDGRSLLTLIREIGEICDMPSHKRTLYLPTLWRYRQTMTMDHISSQFNLIASNKDNFPILHLFLLEEEKVRALKYLYSCLEWQRLVAQKFDKRIDKKFASSTTIGDVLNSVGVDERRRWESAFSGFKEAWNVLWPHVDRYTCMEIPQDWKNIRMCLDIPLCFCLATEKDEGICSLSFLNYMVDKHNKFFEVLSKLRGQEEYSFKLSTRLVKPSHLIQYSMEKELLPFLQCQIEQQLEYGTGTKLKYNFQRIEQHIIDTILEGKPQIELHLKRFSFADETRVTGAINKLKEKIPQTTLSDTIATKTLSALVNNLAKINSILRTLEICVSFLSSTGGRYVQLIPGDQRLVDYIRNTLLLNDVELCPEIEQHVQLQHILWLWELLEGQLETDPFQVVAARFCKPLTPKMTVELERHSTPLDLRMLLPIMKECLLQHLTEDSSIATVVPIKEVLDVCTTSTGDTLGDFSWFKNHFPESIECSYFLSSYTLLKKVFVE